MQDARDKIYHNHGNAAVLALIPNQARTVLDVGCGAGDNARILASRGFVVDGVTFAEAEAQQARRWCRQVYLHNLEQGLPALPDAAYDCIVCSHVIEHICFPQRLLEDIGAALAPKGVLVVALPNLFYVNSRLKLLWGRFDYTPSGLMDETHFRWYTFESGRRLLRHHGFLDVVARAEGGIPLPKVRRFLPAGWLRPIDRWACRLAPGLFGYQSLYVCTRPDSAASGDPAKSAASRTGSRPIA